MTTMKKVGRARVREFFFWVQQYYTRTLCIATILAILVFKADNKIITIIQDVAKKRMPILN